MSDEPQYVAITQDQDWEGYPQGNPNQAFGPATDALALEAYAEKNATPRGGRKVYISIMRLTPVDLP